MTRRGKQARSHQYSVVLERAEELQNTSGDGRQGIPFSDTGRDALTAICEHFRDRPMYYVLDDQNNPTPLGQSYLLTAEERARWTAFMEHPTARTVAETVISNLERPERPVVVHTGFAGFAEWDLSRAYPSPDGGPLLWQTTLLEETAAERFAAMQAAEAEDDDGSSLVEDVPEALPEDVALALKLGLTIEEFDCWIQVYSTREAALQGHEATVLWVRRALGAF